MRKCFYHWDKKKIKKDFEKINYYENIIKELTNKLNKYHKTIYHSGLGE